MGVTRFPEGFEVLVHVLDQLKKTENYEPDIVVFLQATSVIRKDDDIENAIKKLKTAITAAS